MPHLRLKVVLITCSEISRMFVGEGHGARLMEFISFALRHFKSSISLSKGDRLPVPITSQLGLQVKTSLLSYPGKVCASEKSLFVSDTGNGRVVMVDIESGIVSQIFNGFKAPQVCVSGTWCYQDFNFNRASLISSSGSLL